VTAPVRTALNSVASITAAGNPVSGWFRIASALAREARGTVRGVTGDPFHSHGLSRRSDGAEQAVETAQILALAVSPPGEQLYAAAGSFPR